MFSDGPEMYGIPESRDTLQPLIQVEAIVVVVLLVAPSLWIGEGEFW